MAKVLVVDDDATNRKLLLAVLDHEGHIVIEASDGAEALAAAHAQHPQVVISDILMPTMDGYEFVRQLRADPQFTDTPIIFYTAHYHEREARVLAEACQVARVLAKPGEAAAVLEAIEQALAVTPQAAIPVTHEFDREHLKLVTNKLSEQTDELRAANARLAALNQLNVQLASEQDPRLLLEKVCQAARNLFGAKYAVLAVAETHDHNASFFSTSGIDLSSRSLERPRLDAGALGRVAIERRSLRASNNNPHLIDIGLPQGYPPAHACLAAPLSSLSKTYGWLCLIDKLGAEDFSAEDERMLTVLGTQVGRIYENGSLYREVKFQATRLLMEMEQREHATAEMRESEERFRQLAENIEDVFFITVADYSQTLYLSPGYERIWGRPCSTVYANPLAWIEAIHPEDKERVQLELDQATAGEAEKSTLEFRVVHADNSVRWVMARTFFVPGKSGDMGRSVGVITDITERKRSERKIFQLNRVYAVLSGINSLIVRVNDRHELLRESCRLAVDHGQFSFAWCSEFGPDARDIGNVAWSGGNAELAQLLGDKMTSVETDGSLIATAVRSRQPQVCNDLTSETSRVIYHRKLLEHGYKSIVALPLVIVGKTVGCLVLATAERNFFNEHEMRLLVELAGDISFALDHIEKAERLNYLAYYDALTGLANHTFFHERLSTHVNAAKTGERRFALVIAQLERFDTVHESLGRHAADQLIREVAERFTHCVGNAEQVGRIGPDQFSAIIPGGADVGHINHTVEAWWPQWLNSSFKIEGNELRLSANAGIALFPLDGNDADTLLKNAEAALKKAKLTGDRHLFYTQHLGTRGAEKLALETELRQALDSEEFVLYYQPKVDFETRRTGGVEALIRWQHPQRGLVPPVQFIPLMEETGLITDVGAWVIRQACLDRTRWLERGLSAPRIAVNVSTVQLRREDFVRTVARILKLSGTDAGIDIEVTESLIMHDVSENIAKLEAIRDLGVQIAIDDFGTGYSSLGYLARLPAKTIKIDRSFVSVMLDDPGAMTLVSTIISLAHALKFDVVAEGVESEEQAKILRLLRCDQMQGYLISKPLSFDDMTSFLGRRRT